MQGDPSTEHRWVETRSVRHRTPSGHDEGRRGLMVVEEGIGAHGLDATWPNATMKAQGIVRGEACLPPRRNEDDA